MLKLEVKMLKILHFIIFVIMYKYNIFHFRQYYKIFVAVIRNTCVKEYKDTTKKYNKHSSTVYIIKYYALF